MASSHPDSVSRQQYFSLKDPGIKGQIWVSKITVPAPEEDDVRGILTAAIDALKEGGETYELPLVVPVEAEWTGYRVGVDSNRQRPDLSEAQHYARLMKEVKSEVTILYFHGGAYYLMDPASHRPLCSKLAKLTGGRCLSVRYRLAPQFPFPSALLDALVVYLSLLSPPPGSFHQPVPAKRIVFAGDSAGGGISMSLVQLLLQLHRNSPSQTPTVRFHGQNVEIPLPAGVATYSAWLDLTNCMPSVHENLPYDYLPAPPFVSRLRPFPRCKLWPTSPPRGDIYCDASMLCHPLCSPLAAQDWSNSCPLFLIYGSELFTDSGKFVAKKAFQRGVKVTWREYRAMPHCFGLVLQHLEVSKKAFSEWAQFMIDVGEGRDVQTTGEVIDAKTCQDEDVNIGEFLGDMDDEAVKARMTASQEERRTADQAEMLIAPKL